MNALLRVITAVALLVYLPTHSAEEVAWLVWEDGE